MRFARVVRQAKTEGGTEGTAIGVAPWAVLQEMNDLPIRMDGNLSNPIHPDAMRRGVFRCRTLTGAPSRPKLALAPAYGSDSHNVLSGR